jgi:hypothetical protein
MHFVSGVSSNVEQACLASELTEENTMNRQFWNSISFAAACTFIVLTAPKPTSADVVSAIYAGPSAFDYKITNMPDFDQRRSPKVGTPGLPGGGNMYCVPSSTLNMLAYVAKHGYPAVPPGNLIWQLPLTYNTATAELDDLGDLMGTTVLGGTNAEGAFDGTTDYLGGHTGIITVQTYYGLDNWSPQIQDAAGALPGAAGAFAFDVGFARRHLSWPQPNSRMSAISSEKMPSASVMAKPKIKRPNWPSAAAGLRIAAPRKLPKMWPRPIPAQPMPMQAIPAPIAFAASSSIVDAPVRKRLRDWGGSRQWLG